LLENLKSKEQRATLDNLEGKKARKEFNDVVNKTATLFGRLTSTDKKGYVMLKTSALLLLLSFFYQGNLNFINSFGSKLLCFALH